MRRLLSTALSSFLAWSLDDEEEGQEWWRRGGGLHCCCKLAFYFSPFTHGSMTAMMNFLCLLFSSHPLLTRCFFVLTSSQSDEMVANSLVITPTSTPESVVDHFTTMRLLMRSGMPFL